MGKMLSMGMTESFSKECLEAKGLYFTEPTSIPRTYFNNYACELNDGNYIYSPTGNSAFDKGVKELICTGK